MVQVTPPKKPQTLINTPFWGVFLYLIATSKGGRKHPQKVPCYLHAQKATFGRWGYSWGYSWGYI